MRHPNCRQVLECASPLALWNSVRGKSGGGPPQSKTLTRHRSVAKITGSADAHSMKNDEGKIMKNAKKTNHTNKPLSPDLLRKMDAYWRAANYLSVGQIYLYDNPLLKRPLKREHIKPRLLGHWGTTPGLNLIYVHLNRVIKEQDLNVIYITGPGHGGPGLVANTYLGGHLQRSLSQHFPGRGRNEEAVQAIFLSRRHPQPRRAGNARFNPRRRRAGLRAVARVRRGVRQSRFAGRVRRRRWRSRDRPAGHELALEQVSRSRPGWRGAADPPSQRLQNRRPDRAGAPAARRTAIVVPRLRLRTALCGRRRARKPFTSNWPPRSTPSLAKIKRIQAGARRNGFQTASAVADDRVAHAERLDRPESCGWKTDRRNLSRASGPDGRHGQASPRQDSRTLDEKLPAGETFRHRRQAAAGAGGTRAQGHASHERESSRQWRACCSAT